MCRAKWVAVAVVAASCIGVPARAGAPAEPPLPDLPKTQVTIPWSELRALLGQAAPAAPPVDFVLSQAAYTATVEGDRAHITAIAEVNALGQQWTLVPLGPAAAGVVSAKADDQPCQLVLRDKALYALFAGQGKHKLEVVIEQKGTEAPEGRQFHLPLLPSAVGTLTATLPGAGLAVQSDDAVGPQAADKGNTTVFTATYAGAGLVTVSWRPRPPVARPPRLYAESETLAVVDDGLIRVEARVAAQIVHTAAKELHFRLDPKAIVLGVAGKNVANWAEEAAQDAKGVTVTLAKPALGTQEAEVTYELEFPTDGGDVALGVVRLEGALHDQGCLAVASTGAVQVEPGKTDVPRIGVSELPERIRKAKADSLQLAYRYSKPPASVRLTLTRPKPQPAKRLATTDTLIAVRPGALHCQARVRYEVLHTGVDSLRIAIPADIELLDVAARSLRTTTTVTEADRRVLTIGFKDLVKGESELSLTYLRRFKEDDKAPLVPLISHLDAEADRGTVAIMVQANAEVAPTAEGLERIDVKELPAGLWGSARSPILFGYKYSAPAAKLALALTRHEDIAVLVAMSDVCEASTVYTPDGKCVTKMMYVLRNNLKPFMTLKLPEGAELWSALVDDRPVTPARNAKGEVLIPLRKSEEVDEDDEESYRARREKRRSEPPGGERTLRDRVKKLREQRELDGAPRDLKPYDVELVFVSRPVKLDPRGELKASLPQSDIPTGHLAWAIFLPTGLKLVDTAGNLKEVGSFSLPFRHFGEAEYLKRQAQLMQKAEAMQQALREQAKAMDQLAEAAKAQGVLPVRIEIPIAGAIHRFEKLLVVGEAPEMTLTYRRQAE